MRSRSRLLRCAAMAPDRDDDELDDLEDPYEDDDDEGAPQTEVTIEITGLSLYTHHGVSAAEREVGQRLLLDPRPEGGGGGAAGPDPAGGTVGSGSGGRRGRPGAP